MFATARDQAALKEQSGRDARGCKNTKPVAQIKRDMQAWKAAQRREKDFGREM